jgi:hypothetical protein
MYQGYHAEAGGASSTFIIIVSQPCIEDKQGLIPIKDPTKKSDHFLLRRPIARVKTPTALSTMNRTFAGLALSLCVAMRVLAAAVLELLTIIDGRKLGWCSSFRTVYFICLGVASRTAHIVGNFVEF